MDTLDLFAQHLELIQEHETWLEYNCPLCKHSGLKIDKRTLAYKNFKCNCNTKKISLYLFSKSKDYVVERKPREPPVVIPEIPNLLGVKLSPIQNALSLCELSNKYNNPQAKIYYPYSNTQRTTRINKINSTGKKIIFPQVLHTGGWVNGIGDNLFPIYSDNLKVKEVGNELVVTLARDCPVGELIVVVEGEKCVQYLHSQGVEAISVLNSYSTSLEKIKEVLELSKNLIPNVKQFLYIPDLDAVGTKKALTFQQACWSLGVPCKIFDLRSKLLKSSNFETGYDIADYIENKNEDVNLVSTFEDEFR